MTTQQLDQSVCELKQKHQEKVALCAARLLERFEDDQLAALDAIQADIQRSYMNGNINRAEWGEEVARYIEENYL